MVFSRVRDVLLAEWARRVSTVNHQAVSRQVYGESRTTAGYFLLLTLANLIALAGLLTNSVPVIIGAMLISPLMGPILSFGFGFITGDPAVLRFAFRKIGVSVALTILVAAAASYVSPLQLATTEILSRTKPNLFDLIVAILAGTAGAGALCTKRSVLTIVPGVAIATAVIPPLSVCGYGLGTAQWAILWGGFFLFFTNFVAITLVTCIVFFAFGFRPGESTESTPRILRNRMLALVALLVVISIPLVLTLRGSLAEMRDRRVIRAVLQEVLTQESPSTLASLSHQSLEDGTVTVSAVLNTAEYRTQQEIAEAEASLAKALGHPVTLYLEQIKMLHGGAIPAAAPVVRVRSPGETLSDARRDARQALGQALKGLEDLLRPSKLAASSIAFGSEPPAILIHLSIQRDVPLDQGERQFLERYLSERLQQPISLEVMLLPMLRPLQFVPGATDLTEEQLAELKEAGKLYAQGAGEGLQILSQPENPRATRLAKKRLEAAKAYLAESCGVPSDRILGEVARKPAEEPVLVLRFVASPGEPAGEK